MLKWINKQINFSNDYLKRNTTRLEITIVHKLGLNFPRFDIVLTMLLRSVSGPVPLYVYFKSD